MSFPYTLDLMFGSEQSTVDSIGRTSFSKSGGGSGRTTNSFLLATRIYNFDAESPSEEDIQNRYIRELGPFPVTSYTEKGPVITQAKLVLDIVLLEYNEETGSSTRVSPDILGTYHYLVSNTFINNYIQFHLLIDSNGDTILDTTLDTLQYYNKHELYSDIPNTNYTLIITGYLIVDKDNENHYYSTDLQPLIPTIKGYNYVTYVHLKNVKLDIKDTTIEGELREWWDSNPQISIDPYPLTIRGTSSKLVFTPSISGIMFDSIFHSKEAFIALFDSNFRIVAELIGDIVYDNPSEVLEPLSLPSYNTK